MFAVFDGHGSNIISNYVSDNIAFIFRELTPGFAPEAITHGIQQLEKELFIEAGINPVDFSICNCRDTLKNMSILPYEVDLLEKFKNKGVFQTNRLNTDMKMCLLEQKRDWILGSMHHKLSE